MCRLLSWSDCVSLDVLFIWRMFLTAFQRSPGLAQSANRCFMKSLQKLFMILLAVRQDFLYSLRSSSFFVALQRCSSRQRVCLALMASGDSHLVMGLDFLCELTFRGADPVQLSGDNTGELLTEVINVVWWWWKEFWFEQSPLKLWTVDLGEVWLIDAPLLELMPRSSNGQIQSSHRRVWFLSEGWCQR